MRPLSLAHFTVIDADPITLIEAGVTGGFDAVGLRIVPPMPTDTIIPVIGDLPLQRHIKARLADTGIRILDVEAIWLTPQTDVALLGPALELGAALGASYVLVAGHDPDWGRLAGNMGRLCEAAHAHGLRAMLEFIPYSHVRTLAEAHRLLTDVAPADAGILVDALHLSPVGWSAGRPRAVRAVAVFLHASVRCACRTATARSVSHRSTRWTDVSRRGRAMARRFRRGVPTGNAGRDRGTDEAPRRGPSA
ncbi:MAG: hypothetical protein QOH05_4643 [Acetobacteraceae bacterium]|nr:hypothetical protein [Acetobacteraceae bacterium]